MKKTLLLLALAAAFGAAQAQTAAASPAKKELIAKILKIQQPGIESLAKALAEEPANTMLQQASAAIVRVPADKQEAVAKEIQNDARKYVGEAVPLVRDRAVKLAPTTVGVMLEEKFTEDELKQVLAMMESPVYLKFQGLGNDMQRVLTEKVIVDTRPQIGPKIKALEESIGRRLGVAPPAASAPAASGARAPAKK
jgi:hypothetical protein